MMAQAVGYAPAHLTNWWVGKPGQNNYQWIVHRQVVNKSVGKLLNGQSKLGD